MLENRKIALFTTMGCKWFVMGCFSYSFGFVLLLLPLQSSLLLLSSSLSPSSRLFVCFVFSIDHDHCHFPTSREGKHTTFETRAGLTSHPILYIEAYRDYKASLVAFCSILTNALETVDHALAKQPGIITTTETGLAEERQGLWPDLKQERLCAGRGSVPLP